MSNYRVNKDELLNKLTQRIITVEEYRILDDELTNRMEEELVRHVIFNKSL